MPEEIESTLRRLTKSRAMLYELGKKGRQYVEKYYSTDAFATRLKQAYKELQVTQ
jgi:hypothetical protein